MRKGAQRRRAAAESALHWIRVSCIIECFFHIGKSREGGGGAEPSTNSPGRSLLILIPPFSGLTSGIVGMGIPTALSPLASNFPNWEDSLESITCYVIITRFVLHVVNEHSSEAAG